VDKLEPCFWNVVSDIKRLGCDKDERKVVEKAFWVTNKKYREHAVLDKRGDGAFTGFHHYTDSQEVHQVRGYEDINDGEHLSTVFVEDLVEEFVCLELFWVETQELQIELSSLRPN